MDDAITTAVMITEFMNLRMTVVTTGDAIVRSSRLNLIVFQAAEFQTGILIAGLQKTAAATAAIVVGAVGLHVDKVFFPHDGFDHKTKIFGDRITVAFAYDLARILDRKLYF